MKPMLCLAWLSNLAVCVLSLWCLGNLRRKSDIFRYYTYLQNFLAALGSFLFLLFGGAFLLWGCPVPEFVEGARYVTSCGLAAAMLVYALLLSRSGKNGFTQEDFLRLSPRAGNLLLHGVCPILSTVSFALFERELPLIAPIWTGLAALPSALYWAVYLILSAAKLWQEPYDFSSEGKSCAPQWLTAVLIPLGFIGISVLLWEVR